MKRCDKNKVSLRRLRACTPQRLGAIIFMVLVCLIVATLILLGSVSISSKYRRRLRQDLQVKQADWLLDAGARLAVQKAREDDGYRGEEVFVSPALATGGTGVVSILAWPNDENENQIHLKITASVHRKAYPDLKTAKQSTSSDRSSRYSIVRRSTALLIPIED